MYLIIIKHGLSCTIIAWIWQVCIIIDVKQNRNNMPNFTHVGACILLNVFCWFVYQNESKKKIVFWLVRFFKSDISSTNFNLPSRWKRSDISNNRPLFNLWIWPIFYFPWSSFSHLARKSWYQSIIFFLFFLKRDKRFLPPLLKTIFYTHASSFKQFCFCCMYTEECEE